MQWTEEKGRGFSTKKTTYLPASDKKGASVAAQTNEAAAQPNEAAQPVAFDSQLNPDQTFDNYIEGVCNKVDPETMCLGGSHCVACHRCKKEVE